MRLFKQSDESSGVRTTAQAYSFHELLHDLQHVGRQSGGKAEGLLVLRGLEEDLLDVLTHVWKRNFG